MQSWDSQEFDRLSNRNAWTAWYGLNHIGFCHCEAFIAVNTGCVLQNIHRGIGNCDGRT